MSYILLNVSQDVLWFVSLSLFKNVNISIKVHPLTHKVDKLFLRSGIFSSISWFYQLSCLTYSYSCIKTMYSQLDLCIFLFFPLGGMGHKVVHFNKCRSLNYSHPFLWLKNVNGCFSRWREEKVGMHRNRSEVWFRGAQSVNYPPFWLFVRLFLFVGTDCHKYVV